MITCPTCGTSCPNTSKFCPNCGEQFVIARPIYEPRSTYQGHNSKKSLAIWILALSIIILSVVLFLTLTPSQPNEVKVANTENKEKSKTEKASEVTTNVQPQKAVQPQRAVNSSSATNFLNANGDAAISFYWNYRADYERALNTSDFDIVSSYFLDGSAVKQNYREYTLQSRNWNYYFSYTFISNSPSVEALNGDSLLVISDELFELYKANKGKTTTNERTKQYTLKLVNGSFKISNVENIRKRTTSN